MLEIFNLQKYIFYKYLGNPQKMYLRSEITIR